MKPTVTRLLQIAICLLSVKLLSASRIFVRRGGVVEGLRN
jgi:hypothetical protein